MRGRGAGTGCGRQGATKPDSYREVQRLVRPLAVAGKERLKARVRREGVGVLEWGVGGCKDGGR